MYLFAGFTTFVVSLLVSAAAAYFPAHWLVRHVGLNHFRMFDVSYTGRLIARTFVRLASVMAPLLLAFLLATVALLVKGDPVMTNRVEVLPGPAMAAGVRSGDRIVSIDGVTTLEFEDIRRQVKNGKPSHDVVLERDSERLAVSVVPDENGAIKVTPIVHRRTLGLGNALGEASRWLGRFTAGALTSNSKRMELGGPIAIVKSVDTGLARNNQELVLWSACYVVCGVTFLIIAMHLFDGVTYGWYVLSLKARRTVLLEGTLGRRRQALGLALLLGFAGLLTVTAFEIAEVAVGTLAEMGPRVLITLAIPLAWLIARELYGLRRASAFAVLLFVPLLNVVIPIALWFVAGRALRQNESIRGFYNTAY
jgi:hypothetical protein